MKCAKAQIVVSYLKVSKVSQLKIRCSAMKKRNEREVCKGTEKVSKSLDELLEVCI